NNWPWAPYLSGCLANRFSGVLPANTAIGGATATTSRRRLLAPFPPFSDINAEQIPAGTKSRYDALQAGIGCPHRSYPRGARASPGSDIIVNRNSSNRLPSAPFGRPRRFSQHV